MRKKKGLAKFRAKKRSKSTSVAKKNPPLGKDLALFVGPGFAAYAGTRLLSRIIYRVLAKKWPKGSRHVAALSTVAAAAAAWLGAHRIKKLEPYHTPIVVGSGIAALQTAFQTWVPKYGWIVSDVRPSDYGAQANPAQAPAAAEDWDELTTDLGSMGDAADGIGDYSDADSDVTMDDGELDGIFSDADDLDSLADGIFN